MRPQAELRLVVVKRGGKGGVWPKGEPGRLSRVGTQ